jgi:hypothetical protein
VNGRQVQALVTLLVAAFPLSTRAKAPGTLDVLRSFLDQLDHELAEQAVQDVIRAKRGWPTIAAIASAYDARVSERRRRLAAEQERRERDAVEVEPTDDERQRMLEQARAYAAERWGA